MKECRLEHVQVVNILPLSLSTVNDNVLSLAKIHQNARYKYIYNLKGIELDQELLVSPLGI